MKNTFYILLGVVTLWSNIGAYATTHTVTWHVLDQETIVQVDDGATLVVPENINTDYCDDSKIFVGWTDTPINEETDVIPATLFSNPLDTRVKKNADYYAVFAEKGEEESVILDDEFLTDKYAVPKLEPSLPLGWISIYERMVTYDGVSFIKTGDYITSPEFEDEGYSAIKVIMTMDNRIDLNSILTVGIYYDGVVYAEPTKIRPNKLSVSENVITFVIPKIINKFIIQLNTDNSDLLLKHCKVYGLTFSKYSTTCSVLEDKEITNEKWEVDKNTKLNTLLLSGNGVVRVKAGCTLNVKNLTIASDFSENTSGQLYVESSNESHGRVVAEEAYFDVTLGKNKDGICGDPNQWHAFTVPFPVDAVNGVFDVDGNPLKNEVNYAIMDYHGDIRANGQYAWKKYRGILMPGTFYLMTVDGERTTYRFKKVKDAELLAENNKQLIWYSGTGQETDKGWNGVGNPTLMHGKVGRNVQVLNSESYTYELRESGDTIFTVGTPFFVQVSEDDTLSMLTSETPANLAAIRRTASESEHTMKVYCSNDDYTDYLYVSLSETATEVYEIGKDMVKMSMTSTPSVPQIAACAYETNLCMIDVPLDDTETIIPLHLYAPFAGEYTIGIEECDLDAYLMHDGMIVQNISTLPCNVSLPKGKHDTYSLLVRKKVSTHVPSVRIDNQTEKLFFQNQLYIIHEGKMYDSFGRTIKNM